MNEFFSAMQGKNVRICMNPLHTKILIFGIVNLNNRKIQCLSYHGKIYSPPPPPPYIQGWIVTRKRASKIYRRERERRNINLIYIISVVSNLTFLIFYISQRQCCFSAMRNFRERFKHRIFKNLDGVMSVRIYCHQKIIPPSTG